MAAIHCISAAFAEHYGLGKHKFKKYKIFVTHFVATVVKSLHLVSCRMQVMREWFDIQGWHLGALVYCNTLHPHVVL